MGELTDAVHVDAPKERVWDWLMSLAEHYCDWHQDHVSAVWERGEPNRVGSVLTAVEHLGGHREVLRFRMTQIKPNEEMAYRLLGPHALLLPGGGFRIVADDGGCMFTARIKYRFGAVTKRVLARRLAALRRHMQEEGQNLKRLLEAEHRTDG